MSNSLDPDQAQYFVRPDLGATFLQRLSADDTSKQRVKVGMVFGKVNNKGLVGSCHLGCQNSFISRWREQTAIVLYGGKRVKEQTETFYIPMMKRSNNPEIY